MITIKVMHFKSGILPYLLNSDRNLCDTYSAESCIPSEYEKPYRTQKYKQAASNFGLDSCDNVSS